jgi:eukaryotic-like serine/threonine-protein kinase
MSNDALDLAFARHVRQIGLITPEQVNSALQTQSKSTQAGKPISVAEAFVQLGLLTPSQRDTLEKKVREQQAGVQQLGPYKLMKKLGEGGMGAVYLALDPSSQKHVAVKVLPRHLGTNAEFVKRFRREAEAATRLKHPNIIGAFAAGEDLGYHYYVMEYCEGKPLDSILAVEKRLGVPQALDITLQAARGLKFAHDQGIIHRDVKPSNIIVTADGTAKLLDLGLSKNLEESAVSFKTVTGAVLGTPHYISPEQAQGEKNVDGRTDI